MHTPSTRLNDPLWCSQGAAAGVLKPLWALRFGVLLGVLGIEVLGGCWVVGGGCGVKNGFICGLRRLLGRWCSAAGVAFEVPCEVWWAVLWGLGGVLWAGVLQ